MERIERKMKNDIIIMNYGTGDKRFHLSVKGFNPDGLPVDKVGNDPVIHEMIDDFRVFTEKYLEVEKAESSSDNELAQKGLEALQAEGQAELVRVGKGTDVNDI